MGNQTEKPPSVQLAEISTRLFSNCTEKENRHVAKFGVSSVEFKCMRTLSDQQRITVNQLAKRLSLTSSRITRIIDGLVAKKLVVREGGESDRRVYFLSLTPSGKKLSEQLIASYQKIHEEILANIPEQYQNNMIESLEVLNRAVENWLNK